jgi:hypothetical protein
MSRGYTTAVGATKLHHNKGLWHGPQGKHFSSIVLVVYQESDPALNCLLTRYLAIDALLLTA